MASQGTLNLDCITSNPTSSYLYGIASANTDSTSKNPYSDSSVVLVRSNYSPSSITDITWTIVSHVSGKDVSYNYPPFSSVDCAVNDKGEFAAFFRNTYRRASPATLLPMGIRYDHVTGSWLAIQGAPTLYGWLSDRYPHKSFYHGDDIVHLLTDDNVNTMNLGRVDDETNILQPVGVHVWNYQNNTFRQSNTLLEFMQDPSYDYTLKGFFPYWLRIRSGYIILRDGIFYRGDIGKYFTGVLESVFEGIKNITGTFAHPADGMMHFYLFGGRRKNATFFGGLGSYQIPNYTLYTTENAGNRTYLEHPIQRIDNSTDTFAVHQDLQVVGGLLDGQEPFLVALTSVGLYQFTIFGQEAGAMAGPYTVNIPNNINSNATFHSQHQRVIASMRTPPAPLSGDSAMDKGLLGFIIAMLLSAVLTPIISCLVTRRRKHIRAIKEKADEEVRDSISKQEEYFNEGIIPYSESDGGTGKGEHVPGYTGSPGQDNNIVHLGFSRHPRPNIVTSLGDD